MLDKLDSSALSPTPVPGEPGPPVAIDLGATIRAALAGLLRQWWLVLGAVAVMVCVGLGYVLTATPVFTATASIIIDPRINNNPNGETAAPALFLADALIVDSEVQVLKSRALANRLIDRLGLAEDASASEPGPAGRAQRTVRAAFDALTGGASPSAPVLEGESARLQRRERVRRALARNFRIERAGETFVIDISYTSPDPVFAATMANALVDAYLVAQAEATFENTRRLNEWLSGRVAVLAEAVAAADAAVDEYRRENDLFSVRGEMLPGRVELAAANDEVIATRNELVDVEAAIEQVRTLIAQGSVNANIGPESRTPAFLALQNEYTEILSRERELAARLGEDHGLVRQARQDRQRTRQLIFEELKTIVAQLESRRETLRLQIERTMERIEALRVANAQEARKSIRLRELEREAESKRRLYETMLAKLDETSQQETFAPSAARIIAQAVPPDKKSAPRSTLVLALALFGGLVLGGGAAFLREALDDMFRRPDEVEDELGLPFIGIVPRFSNDTRMLQARRGGGPRKAPPAPRRTWIGRRDGRAREVSRLRFAAQNGGSMFAETLRAVAVSLKLRKGGGERCTVVGLTSLRKGEGKSTVAGNFATMQASRGYRVALVDLDVWQPTLAGTLTRVPRQNTLERLLQRPDTVGEIQPIEALDGVFAVTNAGNGDIVLADAATIETFERLLGSLRERFDYVVVDLPAIAGLVDTRVAAEVVDALVLVVEWGRTPRGRLTRTLRANQRIHRRLVGAVYSKVRLRSYFAYNGTAVREYYEY